MASKKGVGSTRNGRDSNPKMLGVKRYAGQAVAPGNILVTQKGTKFHPGKNVRRGGNDSLYAVLEGQVKFETRRGRQYVSVIANPEVVKQSQSVAA